MTRILGLLKSINYQHICKSGKSARVVELDGKLAEGKRDLRIGEIG